MCRYVHVDAAVQSLSYVQLFETLQASSSEPLPPICQIPNLAIYTNEEEEKITDDFF